MLFSAFSVFSLGGHFIHQCATICAILEESIMSNIVMTYMMSVNVYGVEIFLNVGAVMVISRYFVVVVPGAIRKRNLHVLTIFQPAMTSVVCSII